MFRLRSYDISPPGGFPFIQEQGIRHVFPSQPLIEAQARAVSSFRTANNLARSSMVDSLQDVDAYQCQRLGNMAGYCIDSEARTVALNASSPIIAPCRGCGMPAQ